MAINEPEFYIPGVREFIVGDAWPFQMAKTRYESGATLTSPTATVKRLSDGADVSSTFWAAGTGTVATSYVQWSAFSMAAAGDYEIRLSVLVSGNRRTDVQRVKVVA
jgi:hypothetical protein